MPEDTSSITENPGGRRASRAWLVRTRRAKACRVPMAAPSSCSSAWRSRPRSSSSADCRASSSSWSRTRLLSSEAALSVNVTAATWRSSTWPDLTSSTRRSTRKLVLPDPAPASTTRLRSSWELGWRAPWSSVARSATGPSAGGAGIVVWGFQPQDPRQGGELGQVLGLALEQAAQLGGGRRVGAAVGAGSPVGGRGGVGGEGAGLDGRHHLAHGLAGPLEAGLCDVRALAGLVVVEEPVGRLDRGGGAGVQAGGQGVHHQLQVTAGVGRVLVGLPLVVG